MVPPGHRLSPVSPDSRGNVLAHPELCTQGISIGSQLALTVLGDPKLPLPSSASPYPTFPKPHCGGRTRLGAPYHKHHTLPCGLEKTPRSLTHPSRNSPPRSAPSDKVPVPRRPFLSRGPGMGPPVPGTVGLGSLPACGIIPTSLTHPPQGLRACHLSVLRPRQIHCVLLGKSSWPSVVYLGPRGTIGSFRPPRGRPIWAPSLSREKQMHTSCRTGKRRWFKPFLSHHLCHLLPSSPCLLPTPTLEEGSPENVVTGSRESHERPDVCTESCRDVVVPLGWADTRRLSALWWTFFFWCR